MPNPSPEQRRQHSARVRGVMESPVHRDAQEALAAAGRASYCVCEASPWCTGPGGAGWLSCSSTCKACHPPAKRRSGGPVIQDDLSTSHGEQPD
jgi:hypothetical protein